MRKLNLIALFTLVLASTLLQVGGPHQKLVVDDVDALLAINRSNLGGRIVYVKSIDADFEWDPTDTTTPDNGGTVRVSNKAAMVGRWKLRFNGPINVKWFGALSDDGLDDHAAFAATAAASAEHFYQTGLVANGLPLPIEIRLVNICFPNLGFSIRTFLETR